MSVERELAICEGAGVSLAWIGRRLILVSLVLAAIVTSLSLYFGPLGVAQTDILFKQQAERADFTVLAPGRFHPIQDGVGVTYVGGLGEDNRHMEDIFVAEVGEKQVSVVVAAQGKRQVFSTNGEEYLQLRSGRRYDLEPGTASAKVIEFEGYRAKIADRRLEVQSTRIKGASTASLMSDSSSRAQAELHWRFGLFFLIPNVTLLALALCRVNPRQGRFLRLFPAIGLYLLYLGVAMVIKSQVEKNGIEFVPAFYVLHLGIFIAGLLSLMASDGRFRRSGSAH